MALTTQSWTSERPYTKVWPSVLSADGVSILIVVQKTDIHSNQRRSVYRRHLTSNHTRPSVTKRVEGNMLDTSGWQEGHWFQKLCCTSVSDRQNYSDIIVTVDFESKFKQVRKLDLKNHSLMKMTHRLPHVSLVYWEYISIYGCISGYHLFCLWIALQRFHWFSWLQL